MKIILQHSSCECHIYNKYSMLHEISLLQYHKSIYCNQLFYLQSINIFSFNYYVCNQLMNFYSNVAFAVSIIFAFTHLVFIRPFTETKISGRLNKYFVACCLVPRCYPNDSCKHIAFPHSRDWPWINLRFIQPGNRNCSFPAGKHNRRNHDTPAHRPRSHTLYDIPPIRSVFQVTQTNPRSSLMMADYCQDM
jgi:hypothetical protein